MAAAQHTGMMGARHLSQIQEEADSGEHSASFLARPAAAGRAAEVEAEADAAAPRRRSDPASPSSPEQQRKPEDDGSLLEELGRIEAELRESLRLDVERQREVEFLRQQENKMMRQHLSYLSLSQRVAKPWVSSYFRKFPMHMYCLPVQPANHRGRRWGLKKTASRGGAS